jgi:hypothetical protein
MQCQSDRDQYKQRLSEAEKRCKDADVKRSQMVFEFEKEKARWQMEFDNLMNQKRELEDVVSNLERRKELLFKENERIKAEYKANRSSVDGRDPSRGVPRLGLSGSLSSSGSGLPSAGIRSGSGVLKTKPTAVLNQANNILNSSG